MDQDHPNQQWNDTDHHDFVFGEEALDSYVAAKQTYDDDGQGEPRCPPAHHQSRIDLSPGLHGWWAIRVDGRHGHVPRTCFTLLHVPKCGEL